MATGTRGGRGTFRRTVAATARDMKAAELHGQGKTFEAIAAELGLASRGKAHEAVQRAFAAIPVDGAEQAKKADLERLDRLIEQAWAVMLRPHVTVSQGRIVGRFTGFAKHPVTGETFLKDGEPIPLYEEIMDDAPVLAAIDRIGRLIERRARIFGYEAPSRSSVEIITPDAIEANIARLESELAANDAAHTGTA